MAIDDHIACPILIGRPAVIQARIQKAGLRMQPGKDVEICNPEDDPRFRQYWEHYHQLMKRNGASTEMAKAAVRRSNTIIASLMVTLGDADANGSFNDLRFRVRGQSGEAVTVTAPLNAFANPVTDFVHATIVFSDSDSDRFASLYRQKFRIHDMKAVDELENDIGFEIERVKNMHAAGATNFAAISGYTATASTSGFPTQVANSSTTSVFEKAHIDLRDKKRYLRVLVDGQAGTTSFISIVAVLGRPSQSPTGTNTGALYVVNPS